MKNLFIKRLAVAIAALLVSAPVWAQGDTSGDQKNEGQKYNMTIQYVTSTAYLKKDNSKKHLEVRFQFPEAGGEEVSSIDYEYSFNGKTKAGRYVFKSDLVRLMPLELPFDNPAEPGSYEMEFKVIKVNDSDCSGEDLKATGYVDVLDLNHRPPYKALCEAYVSCANRLAPILLQKFNESVLLHDNGFVGVIYHYDDPMAIMEVENRRVMLVSEGAREFNLHDILHISPYEVDRMTFEAPFTDDHGLTEWEKAYENRVSPVAISSSASWINGSWLDGSLGDIEVQTTVQFFNHRKDADYKIGYIVTGDGLCGDGEKWALHNCCSGLSYHSDGDMGIFPNLPEVIENYIYDDVALITRYAKGVDGSLPSEFHPGDTERFTFTIPKSEITDICNLSEELLPVNYDKIKIISFVIDPSTGEILNSNKCPVRVSAGVEGVEESETVSVERFDINGNPVDESYKGICIVREIKADGTVKSRKEVIR